MQRFLRFLAFAACLASAAACSVMPDPGRRGPLDAGSVGCGPTACATLRLMATGPVAPDAGPIEGVAM